MKLNEYIKKFFNQSVASQEPFLLGLSGGPDSMALFYLLLSLKEESHFNFSVAHVNHHWREESDFEAKKLEEIVESHGVVFHLLDLNPSEFQGNIESYCRNLRLQFFKDLSHQYGYKAIILGHHKDDLAETVLKRLFEGAVLSKMQGLKKETELNGLKVLRPLLDFKKSEILDWLKEKNISFFNDKTNEDLKYLRARCRHEILPFLNQTFGKEVTGSLYRLSIQSQELEEYLEWKFSLSKNQIIRDKNRLVFDFSSFESSFEIKAILRKIVEEAGFYLSYSIIDQATIFIKTGATNKSFFMKGRKLIFHKKKMTIYSNRSENECVRDV